MIRILSRACLACLVSSLVATAAWAQAPASPRPPNILLVIADDMGRDASPCHDLGAAKPNMPVLTELCREGLVFDNAWSQPVCSPTRATSLTGRYGFRTGVLDAVGPRARSGGIGFGEVSLHRLLDAQAPVRYDHAVIGKWHLGDALNGGANSPGGMGVGHYSGVLIGELRDYYSVPLTTNGITREVTGYATTVLTDEALRWLAGRASPWFLWLAYTAPHVPFHAPPADLLRQKLPDASTAIQADPRPYYFAALEALDHELGRLLDSLPPATRAETIVMFLGDNGTPPRVAQLPYGPNTAKGTLFPGGITVPLVVSGAGVTRRGQREAAPVNTTDLYATIADLAGIPRVAAEDSFSFKSLLQSPADPPRNWAYAEYRSGEPGLARNNGWTIRDERHQLLVLDTGRRALFDLAGDPGGRRDLLREPTPADAAIAARLSAWGAELRGR